MRGKDQGFCMGLELTLSVYERLYLKKRLRDECKDCPVMEEIAKLLELSKGRQLEDLEEELGYFLT